MKDFFKTNDDVDCEITKCTMKMNGCKEIYSGIQVILSKSAPFDIEINHSYKKGFQ